MQAKKDGGPAAPAFNFNPPTTGAPTFNFLPPSTSAGGAPVLGAVPGTTGTTSAGSTAFAFAIPGGTKPPTLPFGAGPLPKGPPASQPPILTPAIAPTEAAPKPPAPQVGGGLVLGAAVTTESNSKQAAAVTSVAGGEQAARTSTATAPTGGAQEQTVATGAATEQAGAPQPAQQPPEGAPAPQQQQQSPPELPQGANLTFTQLEDLINKWTGELGELERLFLNQATQINAWDHLLATNCQKLASLSGSVERVKADQKKINYDLDFILGQQKELDACLAPLEKEYTSSIYTNDVQREKIYLMAENIDSQLKRMSEDLKETIEHINETSRSQESVDPVVQIGKILNAHMNSLQWIDENTTRLQSQLEQVSKAYDGFKRSADRFDAYY